MSDPPVFRAPAVAGSFYPGHPDVLSRRIRDYLKGDPVPGPLDLRAVLVPHAGYDYSGPTAGVAYREVGARMRAPEAVVVIGPSHYDRFQGASAYPGKGYRTPLGSVPYPPGLLPALVRMGAGINENELGHREEHSVEVQIPFLQESLPGVPILPLVLADDRPETCERIGGALAEAIGDRMILLVASTDLYHGSSHKDCVETDERTLSIFERNDPREIAEECRSGRLEACGRGPVQVVLAACRRLGAERVRVLAHTNSDEVMGRHGGYVVGYAAACITGE